LPTVFFGRDTFDVHEGRYAVNVANASTQFTMAHNWSQVLLVGPEEWGKDLVLSIWTRNVGVEGRAYVKVDAYRDTISKMAHIWGIPRDDAAARLGINFVSDPSRDLAWKRLVFSDAETGWVRREVRVFLPPTTNVVFVRGGIIGIGQLILDDASLALEPAQAPEELPLGKNLLADPGFEGDGNLWEYSIPPYPEIRAERDTTVFRSGKASLRFTSLPTAMIPGPTGVAQVFCNRNLSGKRVRFSAFIKPDSLRSSAFIKLLCKTPDDTKQEVSKNIISGTMDWTEAKLEIDVPPETYALWAWINYTAPARGYVHFDDASLEVLGPATAAEGSRSGP